MSFLHSKGRDFREQEGELYVKVTDGNYNKIYENKIGIKDKKGIIRLLKELESKGVPIRLSERELYEQWW